MIAPKIMGIVNVTPDSFSDGGKFLASDLAVEHALALVAQGADILDVGGESTRPGAAEVTVSEEYARVIPVIERLSQKTDKLISIDTRKPEIAEAAKKAGAHIWNDVSALTFSENSMRVAADLKMPIVLMHAQGSPETMQDNPQYGDVVQEVKLWLARRINACEQAGIPPERLIVDPGIGFGKTLEHNLTLLNNLGSLRDLGCPVLLGASRKRFIETIDRAGAAEDRVGGSLAAVLAGLEQGAGIFRVHDVAETRQAIATYLAIKSVNP